MTRVLFVGGHGRSGSTLLDRLLDAIPGVVGVGELNRVWDRGVVENQLCGCGVPFHDCPFWTSVMISAFGDSWRDQGGELAKLRLGVERLRNIPRLRRNARDTKWDRDALIYKTALAELFSAIAKVSNARLIVDSSKDPPYGFVLSSVLGDKLSVVHLVRDSRAVAYSLQRARRRPEVHWQEAFMPRRGATRAAVEWSLNNLFVAQMRRANLHYRRLRYEDLVTDPSGSVASLLRWVAVPEGDSWDPAGSGKRHSVSGNPMRFEPDIKISLDDEWIAAMDARQRSTVTLLTWPLLVNYGYLRRNASRPACEAE